MEHIWAPWRIKYIEMPKPDKCILCEKAGETDDAANYLLYRAEQNFIILNSYPYNPGHIMVAPYRHVAVLEELEEGERNEHFALVCRATTVLKQVFRPAGFNIGINLGKIAGAGIDDHVHTHLVPRWQGDTNFMTVTADVRVLPEALASTYEKLKGRFQPPR
ncbi:MAG: HIT domain-containing protein [Chloroflexi bacterium]|nr:HIT domain-containing protein [Chloroflexota bacterium]